MSNDNDQVAEEKEKLNQRIRAASTLCEILWREGTFQVPQTSNMPVKKEPVVRLLGVLAMCLVRNSNVTAAIGLYDDRLRVAACDTHDSHLQNFGELDAENSPHRKDNEAWIKSAQDARSPTSIVQYLYRNCRLKALGYGKFTKKQECYADLYSLGDIDLESHGQVVFTLFRNIVTDRISLSEKPETNKSLEQKLSDSRMTFMLYILGTSLSKLGTLLKEPTEMNIQQSWPGFLEFLDVDPASQRFKDQQIGLQWSPRYQDQFSTLLDWFSPDAAVKHKVQDQDHAAIKQKFRNRQLTFDRDTALFFHNIIKVTLKNIIHLHGKVFSEEDGKKKANDGHKEEAKDAGKKEHAKDDGSEDEEMSKSEEKAQNSIMQKPGRAINDFQLPHALNLYVESCPPICRSNHDASNVLGQLKDLDDDNHQKKRNQALNEEAKNQEEIDDENLDHEISYDDPNKGDLRKWQERYKQWIRGIVSQFGAASYVAHMEIKGHTSRIQSTEFEFISAGQAPDKMEPWKETIQRALEPYPTECGKVVKALSRLRDWGVPKGDLFQRLHEDNWKFPGAVTLSKALPLLESEAKKRKQKATSDTDSQASEPTYPEPTYDEPTFGDVTDRLFAIEANWKNYLS
ncbi:MAG: hypothetical protein Q9221_000145 [Calogaya cf. arnoldii]